jgi:hypothetical protein
MTNRTRRFAMSVATMKRKIAVFAAIPIAAGGLTLAGAAWNAAGVYDRPSHNSLSLAIQESGDRVTGPLGSAHISKDDGFRGTKDDGWRTNKDDGFRGTIDGLARALKV